MSSVSGWVSTPVTELAIVICNPSRIHAAPSPATMRVWNGDQPSRSRRAGTVVRIGACRAAVSLISSPFRGGLRLACESEQIRLDESAGTVINRIG